MLECRNYGHHQPSLLTSEAWVHGTVVNKRAFNGLETDKGSGCRKHGKDTAHSVCEQNGSRGWSFSLSIG